MSAPLLTWGRPLDCLAEPGAPALPIYSVRPESLGSFLTDMDDQGAASFLRASGFAAAAGAIGLLPGPAGLGGAVLGLGEAGSPYAFGALPYGLPADTAWRFAGPLDSLEDAVLGFCLGAYRYSALKQAGAHRAPARLVLSKDGGAGAGASGRATRLAETVWLVRDLVNTPANLLGPAELAAAARDVLAPIGAEVGIVEGDRLAAEYPLVAAVGAGSRRNPRIVVARWSGAEAAAKAPLISLCGKGVCFDTGGYDIKPGASMLRMKKDMAGAAIALGVARLIILAGLPVRLELRLGCVENSISGAAMRPSDVIRSRRGLTVAVGNTDAEGRLVLADLLAEASDQAPDVLMDFATLTGAARVALGPEIIPVFSNDDALAETILTAGRLAHEPAWRLPLHDSYINMLDSNEADLNNVSDKPFAGAIIAALFLKRFVAVGPAWAHFDLYAWNDTSRPGKPEGGEAQGLRTAFSALSRIVHDRI